MAFSAWAAAIPGVVAAALDLVNSIFMGVATVMSMYFKVVVVGIAKSARTSVFLVTRADGECEFGTCGRSCSAKGSKPM